MPDSYSAPLDPRGRRRKITPHQERELAEWYRARVPMKVKAAQLGVSLSTLHATLQRLGLLRGVGHLKAYRELRRRD